MTINVIVDPNRPRPNITLSEEVFINQVGPWIWDTWNAIPDKHSVIRSISRSHKQIVAWAKENEVKEVMICEEDVMFLGEGAIKYFLDNKPAEFDLYLGGTYGLNSACKERLLKAGPGAHEIHNFTGLHCYMISERYYEKFLSLPEEQHIDDQPGLGKFYVCFPFIALQHPGWSSNNKREVDYNETIPKELRYGNTKD